MHVKLKFLVKTVGFKLITILISQARIPTKGSPQTIL